MRSGKLLGFVVSGKGIEVDPAKVKAIQEMPAPRTAFRVFSPPGNPFLPKSPFRVFNLPGVYIFLFIPNFFLNRPFGFSIHRDAHFSQVALSGFQPAGSFMRSIF